MIWTGTYDSPPDPVPRAGAGFRLADFAALQVRLQPLPAEAGGGGRRERAELVRVRGRNESTHGVSPDG